MRFYRPVFKRIPFLKKVQSIDVKAVGIEPKSARVDSVGRPKTARDHSNPSH